MDKPLDGPDDVKLAPNDFRHPPDHRGVALFRRKTEPDRSPGLHPTDGAEADARAADVVNDPVMYAGAGGQCSGFPSRRRHCSGSKNDCGCDQERIANQGGGLEARPTELWSAASSARGGVRHPACREGRVKENARNARQDGKNAVHFARSAASMSRIGGSLSSAGMSGKGRVSRRVAWRVFEVDLEVGVGTPSAAIHAKLREQLVPFQHHRVHGKIEAVSTP